MSRIFRLLAATVCLAGGLLPAAAQQPAQPFSMGLETPAGSPAQVERQPAVSPAQPAPTEGSRPSGFDMNTAPVRPATASAVVPVQGAAALDRRIIPMPRLRLGGEIASRTWQVHITNAQAAAPTTLTVAYLNSIMVMPEGSRLRALINGQPVMEFPIASSEREANQRVTLPANLLKPGPNVIRFEAVQRHRTDCTIASTYELWTDVLASGTGFNFKGIDGSGLLGIDDLPAAPMDESGANRLLVIAPSANRVSVAQYLADLSQALALRGRYSHPVITVTDTAPATAPEDTVVIAFGTGNELSSVLGTVPPEAETGPIVKFVNDERLGSSVLVVAGRSWSDVGSAVGIIAQGVDRPLEISRTTLFTSTWSAPDAPFLTQDTRFPLSDAGVPTQEFEGRRFQSRFTVGLPSDFYAQNYGEATLLLDAAYTALVRPGSHLDITVNGQIATTIALAADNGAIFRKLPLNVPLRNFRPGVNEIGISVDLVTANDMKCAPGATLASEPRFVLFDTSEFVMPTFARIARLPDLATFSGTGFPYGRSLTPIAVVLGRHDPQTYSAAATLIAKLSLKAGRLLKLNLGATTANVGESNALFIGTVGQLPPATLAQTGLAEDLAVSWKPTPQMVAVAAPNMAGAYDRVVQRFAWNTDAAAEDENPGDVRTTDQVMERWRTDLAGGGGWRGSVSRFEDWLQRTFDISFASLRLTPAAPPPFRPSARASLLIAQGQSPMETGTWTVITGPSPDDLVQGASMLTAEEVWPRIEGRITTFQPDRGLVQAQPIAKYKFVPTQSMDITNNRLIAANWLSTNILPYALLLGLLGIILGVATSIMLRQLGRSS